jgi:hypothetical protein
MAPASYRPHRPLENLPVPPVVPSVTVESFSWSVDVPRKHNDPVQTSVFRALYGVVALLIVGLFPAAAKAHPPSQQLPDANYYQAQLTDVSSIPAGVTVRVDPGAEWLELSNGTAEPVEVLGYTGEPYLRITSSAAQENLLSQTTYLNRSLFADSVPSAQNGAAMAPAWHQIAPVGTARWHDHRIHWMGRTQPPAVAADPVHRHLVGTWVVHAIDGRTPFDIHGSLMWVGKPADARPSPVTAWLLTVVAGLVVAVAVLLIALVRSRRRRHLRAPARWSLDRDDDASASDTHQSDLEQVSR